MNDYTSIENSCVLISNDGKKIRLEVSKPEKSEIVITKDITGMNEDQIFDIQKMENYNARESEGVFIGTNVYENPDTGESIKTAVYAMQPLGILFRICGMRKEVLNVVCQELLNQYGLVVVRSGTLKDLGLIKKEVPGFLNRECWLNDQGYILGSDSNVIEGIYYYNTTVKVATIQRMSSIITGEPIVGAHDVWPIVEIDYKEVEDRL